VSIFKHNIYFKVGQPNTGKSHGFSQTEVKNCIADTGYRELKYKKVSVSGGEGNEFRGLQSSDLAISFDPVNSTIVCNIFKIFHWREFLATIAPTQTPIDRYFRLFCFVYEQAVHVQVT